MADIRKKNCAPRTESPTHALQKSAANAPAFTSKIENLGIFLLKILGIFY